MQKNKRKETIVIFILVVVLVLAGIKIISMEKYTNQIENELSKSQEELKAELKEEANSEIIQISFFAGMNSLAKELFYIEGALSEEDYYYLSELEEEMLENPTYENVEKYLNAIEEILKEIPGMNEALEAVGL